jgi:hypothetical protein
MPEYTRLFASPAEFSDFHEVEALYYFCMDARFRKQSADFKNFLGRASYDRQIAAGGSLVFFAEEYGLPPVKDFMLFSADFARQYHHVREIILCDHDDCGAYRSVLAQKLRKERSEVTLDEIKREQEMNLLRARELLAARYPGVKVTLVRAAFADDDKRRVAFYELN